MITGKGEREEEEGGGGGKREGERRKNIKGAII